MFHMNAAILMIDAINAEVIGLSIYDNKTFTLKTDRAAC